MAISDIKAALKEAMVLTHDYKGIIRKHNVVRKKQILPYHNHITKKGAQNDL